MLRHFHLTRRQWLALLKWSIYALLFLMTVVVQSVILARTPVFGAKLAAVPILLCCICIREGSEKGGLFVLLAALFWSQSGVDYGNLSILTVTALSVLSAVLCDTVLSNRFVSAALCCFLTNLLNETVIFPFKVVLSGIAPDNFWQVLLPGAVLSMLLFPVLYLPVKAISRIGGDHGV